MKDQFRQKLHISHLSRLCRRTVALTLALAMMLPTTVAFGAGGVEFGPSIRVPHPLEAGEIPTITVEANAVVNRWYDKAMGDPSEYLTGDLEVAIRVKSGQLADGTWQPFNTLGVALDYSPILTPYKWTLIDGIDLSGEDLSHLTPEERVAYKTQAPNVTEVDLTKTVTDGFKTMTSMQTLKSKQITAAVAHVSGQMERDSATGNVTAVKDGHLYMMAQSDRPVVLEKDTVLAVVTFKYDVENIKILASEAEDWLSWLLPGVSTAAEGDGTEPTDPGTGGTTTPGGLAPEDQWLVRLTNITDTNENYFGGEVRYDSQSNSMYHSANRVGVPNGTGGTVDNYIELSDKLAVEEEKLNFTLVNQTTYNDGGLTLDDLATVLFYDWDDTLLGLVIVPKDGDARKIVNDYVSSHFIHPKIAEAPEYTSLARVHNYRGKYPATAAMEDGKADDTVVTDGGEYALTNKLDYVFFKRPMEQVMEEKDGKQVPTGEWKQRTKAGAAGEEGDWDTEYPYLYGWAIVPDYRHPENVWTTLGMGELSNYSGAANGGYKEVGTAPTTVTSDDETFAFADFDFRVKNKNSLKAGSIYAVKAVYEPGENLLASGLRYRMISEPYYNKLNAPAASAGGAYSVDVIFERATTEVGDVVRGVARIREPGVRQDTTTDLKWEEDEELGVSHNLKNATVREAYTSKNKTTYTKIDIKNTEEVPFSLTLSARQNKVDYYIKEMYDSNFVVGGARTENDNNRDEMATTIDNYNYRVTGSDMADEWYDAEYSDREGSYGFVLIGTLHQLMELATQCNSGQLEVNDLYTYVTADTLADVNLRVNADGKNAEAFEEIEFMVEALLAAAQDAKDNHYGQAGYWNNAPDYNCAELNYHQLQLFVLDYATSGSAATLRDPDAADVEILKWCHLHDECVAKTSGKPRNWKELIETAKLSDGANKIALLTATEMENIAHLRADLSGTPFNTVNDFAAAVIAAVKAGYSSWDTVQDYIIRGKGDAAYAQANYWWYDGSTSVRLNNWNNLIATTVDIFNDVTLPDGTVGKRYAKFNQLKPAFNANNILAGDEAAEGWIMATENLVKTDSAEKFDSFEEFTTAFTDALTALGNEATWYEVQYYILNGTDPALDPDAENQYTTYYWHNGGRKVTDVASMLDAAQRANRGDTVSWDAFTYADLYAYPGLQFRKDFTGVQYSAAEFDAFKDTIKTIASQSVNRGWDEVQYILIHGGLGIDVANEAAYYWWADAGEGEAVDFSSLSGYSNGLELFLEAAFRYEINGNIHAWDNLTTDMIKTARLIASDNGSTTFDALGHFADTAAFQSALTGLTVQAGAIAPSVGQSFVKPDSTMVTWQQMQYYLLNGGTYDPAWTTDYWWRLNDSKESQKKPEEYFAEVISALQDVFDSGDTTAIDTWIRNVDNLNAVFLNPDDPAGGFTQDYADMYADSGASIWPSFVDSGAFSSAADVSWYQIQAAFTMWGYSWMGDSDLLAMFTDMGMTVPDWVPAPVSVFALMLMEAPDATSAQVMTLTNQINSLIGQLKANPDRVEEYAVELKELMVALEELRALLEDDAAPMPVEPPGPTESVDPTESPKPAESLGPVETSRPTESPEPSETPEPTGSAEPTESPKPTESLEPIETFRPTESPEPSETPEPTESVEPTEPPEPAESVEPIETSRPTESLEPAESSKPTETPNPIESEELGGEMTPDDLVEESTSKEAGTPETMPEVVEPPLLLSSDNDKGAGYTTEPKNRLEKFSRMETEQEGGDGIMFTIANRVKGMPAPPFIRLLGEKLRKPANGSIMMTAYTRNEAVETINRNASRQMSYTGGLYTLARYMPGIRQASVPPNRLLSRLSDSFTIFATEGRVQV